jgi:hypothetical protein
MPYQILATVKGSAYGIVVDTASDALEKIAELTELGHIDISVKDMLGQIVDKAALEYG